MTAPQCARAVIFDLDGTLVQTRRASWDVFRKINDEFGLGLNGPQEYFALFNGNIFKSLEALCRGRADSEQVRKKFLDRLRNEYNPAMVPGIADVIRRLAGQCTLAVVSSNAMEVLRRVLVDNGVAYCFAHVFGGDVAPDKTAAIRSLLSDTAIQYGRRCQVIYDETPAPVRPDPSTTVLVTDTAGDIRDALDAGIRAIGVAWGMHNSDELSEAGAEFVAIWPQELPGYLLGDGAVTSAGSCAVSAGAVTALGGAARCDGTSECACGCPVSTDAPRAVSVAAQLAAAAVIRRGRRQRASHAARRPVGPGTPTVPSSTRAGAESWEELRDAARRILSAGRG
jgi:phosphoglycolate phosphatase